MDVNKMSCLNMAPKRWKSGQEEIQRINLKTLLILVDVEFVNCITLKLLEELEDNKKKMPSSYTVFTQTNRISCR